MWLPILTGVFTVWVAGVAVVIILQRRSAAATLSWLFALAFLPIVGLVIYRVIGPLRLERKKVKRSATKRMVGEALAALAAQGGDSLEHRQLARVGMQLGEASPLRASMARVFLDGASTYAAILAAVAAARHHVHLEYYIWEPDQIGTQLRDALVERARAGIKVRMLVDGTGSNNLTKTFYAPLLAAGVEVARFNPIRLTLRLRRPDFRTHRKIVVCDGAVGFTGGMNITDAHSPRTTGVTRTCRSKARRGPARGCLVRVPLLGAGPSDLHELPGHVGRWRPIRTISTGAASKSGKQAKGQVRVSSRFKQGFIL